MHTCLLACMHAMPAFESFAVAPSPTVHRLIAPTSTDVRDLVWHRLPQMFCTFSHRPHTRISPTFRADLHGFSLPLAGYPFGDLHECSPTFRTDLFAPASTDVRIGRRIQFKMLFAYVGVINSFFFPNCTCRAMTSLQISILNSCGTRLTAAARACGRPRQLPKFPGPAAAHANQNCSCQGVHGLRPFQTCL